MARVRIDLRVGGNFYRTLYNGDFGSAVRRLGCILGRSVDFYRVLETIEREGEYCVKGRVRLRRGVPAYFTDKARHKKGSGYPPYTGWYNAQLAIVPIDDRPEPEDDEF